MRQRIVRHAVVVHQIAVQRSDVFVRTAILQTYLVVVSRIVDDAIDSAKFRDHRIDRDGTLPRNLQLCCNQSHVIFRFSRDKLPTLFCFYFPIQDHGDCAFILARCAIADPIPRAPPVTTITFP